MSDKNPIRVSKSVQGAVRQFSLWIANGTVGNPLLNGIDYFSEMQESPSFMEQVFAFFMNNLELDENGNVLNFKYAEKRAAQSIRCYMDSSYEAVPTFEDWESELHGVSEEHWSY